MAWVQIHRERNKNTKKSICYGVGFEFSDVFIQILKHALQKRN